MWGKGIYASSEPFRTRSCGHNAKKVFICLSLPGKQYEASNKNRGKKLEEGYDSHYKDDELVFFNCSHLLPYFLSEPSTNLFLIQEKLKHIINYIMEYGCNFE